MVDTAKESIGGSATSLEIYGKMEEVFIKMDSEENVSLLTPCYLTYLYVPTKTKLLNLTAICVCQLDMGSP
jgi:hypothetical protein